MMENGSQLPESLIFEADGHLSEVALSCLADGESALLPEAASVHIDACDACTARLGAVALLSVGATDALLAMAARDARAPAAAREEIVITMPLPEVMAPAPSEGALHVAGGLQSRAPSAPVSSRRRRPLPIFAIAAALLIAAAFAAPTWLRARELPDAARSIMHALPPLARVARAFVRGASEQFGGAALAARWIAAVLFIMAGWALARTMTRRQSLQGDVG